ncbi:aspartate aminotransferase family protein [Halobacillus litoralis]|uniref:pyridoxal phosphate-dependent decarboxylase family protein n=1 Tax=Halobacillus litoralis TaxID=45668 RepID=UPI001CD1A4B1|nr:pyridoxal-dependent decarboxylase [Halobacillus litoralis]MCA0970908.1 aspartate aminotransferase family protein [Halobacillus litoralis]
MKPITSFYPSVDGNEQEREQFVGYLEELLTRIDELKDPERLTLGDLPAEEDMYKPSDLPIESSSVKKVIEELIELAEGHRFGNHRYVANASPLPNIPSLLGQVMMTLVNGNNLWDVEGTAAARAEVKVTSMLSKIIGYDPEKSGGFTTWGGQGAVFQSLRLAIARQFPDSNEEGVPQNLYAFCSELSHYSLFKSMQAAGIGTNHLIRVKTGDDHAMDPEDLMKKMKEVISNGGVPIYVLASTGTTDTFGIDDVKRVKEICREVEESHNLDPIYLHADSAMGGMYTFFNDYPLVDNPLQFKRDVVKELSHFQEKFRSLKLADSLVFDFHKLGQTPYISSLFLVKDASVFQYVDLNEEETPYVGNRGYGSYHTSYTLECSRMGSSLPIYASLIGLGIEGYQRLLAQYIEVNLAFRRALKSRLPNIAVTNDVSPITTFRLYPGESQWEEEKQGRLTRQEVEDINKLNSRFAEVLGQKRDEIYFGNTSRQRYVTVQGGGERPAIYVQKFFSISPYTTVDCIPEYIDFLERRLEILEKEVLCQS